MSVAIQFVAGAVQSAAVVRVVGQRWGPQGEFLESWLLKWTSSSVARVPDRVEVERDAAIAVLERFYESSDEHTKRMALLSLGALDYPQIAVLLRRSWEIPDEHHRMACLAVLARRTGHASLLNEFLELAAELPGTHLASMRRELLAQQHTGVAEPRDP